MKKTGILTAIFIFFLISSIIAATNQPKIYYKINLKYDRGKINITNLDIDFSNKQIDNYYGLYSAKVVDFNGKTLSTTSFSVPKDVLVDYVDNETGQISGGGMVELNETEFELYIPYSESAKDIVLLSEKNEEITKRGVSEYSKIDEQTISSNKAAGDGKSGKNNKANGTSTGNENSIFRFWWILLILIAAIVISIILVKKEANK